MKTGIQPTRALAPWRNAALAALTLVVSAVVATPAQAGRPLFADDAAIVDAGACQLEAWVVRGRGDRSEQWVLPACNVTGNLELAVGAARSREGGDSDMRGILQGKTVFKPLEANGWGVGLVVGNEFGATTDRPVRNRIVGDLYATVPVSFSFDDDRVLLHANLGWLRERVARKDRATYALATEYALTRRTALLAETFGESSERPFYHIGIRHWLVPDRLQIDASYGNRFGADSQDRFFTLGIAIFTDAFLR